MSDPTTKDDDIIPMSSVLRGATEAQANERSDVGKSSLSIVEQDLARRATGQPTTATKTISAPIAPLEAPTLAAKSLTEAADVPYGGATAGLGRDVSTRIAELEQRLKEIDHDIHSSKEFASQAQMQVTHNFYEACARLKETAEAQMDFISNNSMQEVAILRGRESDIVKAMGHLKGVQKALQSL